MTPNDSNTTTAEMTFHAAFSRLRRGLPDAVAHLGLDLDAQLKPWAHALDVKLLPKLQPDFPLVVAICGGGSAGKSTLFNSLIGQPMSPTGGRAGLNRRVLVALQDQHIGNDVLMQYLSGTFGGELKPMESPEQLTTAGQPVYCRQTGGSANVVLLDTPDIDTGAKGDYANRELARQSLESADAFIYIFTNATYNNRDNTDFIAHLLTGLGTRPCYLVYRVYPSFSDAEVREHAHTAAANLYGAGFHQHILGIFRADEDNSVAAGEKPPTLRSITNNSQDLHDALAVLDPKALRQQLVQSMTEDAVGQADRMRQATRTAHGQLADYIAALEKAQNESVRQALSHFPTDRVLNRFADIWLTTDPTHIKWMRTTGRVVEWPLKLVVSAVKAVRSTESSRKPRVDETDPSNQFSMDLLQAANSLYQQAVDNYIHNGLESVFAPAVVRGSQEQLRQENWQAILTHIQGQTETILSWSESLESDLKTLAEQLRREMGLWDQIRQTFAAMLNVIPATAAITYILHTGDPAGAVGIKVKLTGLLGLNDLYALIAIPATAGLKKADQQQMAQMLAPVARTWLTHKLQAVQVLFEQQITGRVLTRARTAYAQATRELDQIDRDLETLEELAP